MKTMNHEKTAWEAKNQSVTMHMGVGQATPNQIKLLFKFQCIYNIKLTDMEWLFSDKGRFIANGKIGRILSAFNNGTVTYRAHKLHSNPLEYAEMMYLDLVHEVEEKKALMLADIKEYDEEEQQRDVASFEAQQNDWSKVSHKPTNIPLPSAEEFAEMLIEHVCEQPTKRKAGRPRKNTKEAK